MSLTKFKPQATPLAEYIWAHSLRMNDAEKFLYEKTQSDSRCYMLISADVAQLLANLCRALCAKKTLDIGVYTGYSSLSVAQAIPDDGQVIACDITDTYLTDFCLPAWRMAGVASKIDFRLGPAIVTLQGLLDAGQAGTFDFALIDADKPNYLNYYELCLQLLRPGGLIAVDNVLWQGCVFDMTSNDLETKSIRLLNDLVKTDKRIHISMLSIGDGLSLLFKA